MSKKYSNTTADYLDWNEATNLVRRLFDDQKYNISLFVALGVFWGLRCSDLRKLAWIDILGKDEIVIFEQKTGKRRPIAVNQQLQRHIKACFAKIAPASINSKCFVSQMGTVYSIQRLNGLFKELKIKYSLNINNFSTHSLRKTFGRRVVSSAGSNSEMALIKLSELFNHSNTAITRRYLGLKQDELKEVYTSLAF